uniref:Uncharacterized protein n=1 Tax=Oryza brachyantha TaxID=4533 RepID=J3L833_ORYBR
MQCRTHILPPANREPPPPLSRPPKPPSFPSLFQPRCAYAVALLRKRRLLSSSCVASHSSPRSGDRVLVVLGLYAFLWGKGKELKLAAAAEEQRGGDVLANYPT